jgi:hypothetical protein
MKQESRHQCIIYSGAPSERLPIIAAVMYRMMLNGYRCFYLNSPRMVTEMRSYLSTMGINVAMEEAESRMVFSSELVTVEGVFDIDTMLRKLEGTLDQALKDGYKGLWASGDMTWELGAEKNFEKIIEYEWKLEALFQRRKQLHGVCQYHCDTLPTEVLRHGLLMHPSVLISQSYSYQNPLFSEGRPSETIAANPLLDKMVAEFCNCISTASNK